MTLGGGPSTSRPWLDSEPARITVCICTHNRPDYLRDCLDGLRVQDADAGSFDVMVIDSGSSPLQAARIAEYAAEFPSARLIRVDLPGLSVARNVAARACGAGYIAYIDDDAIPHPDWIAAIRAAVSLPGPPPAMVGGAIRPLWEAPLPGWWPGRLQAALTIIEVDGAGEYGQPGVARTLEPYGANMIVHVPDLLAVGGFMETIGRIGEKLLSDEEKVLAWRLQERGLSVRYDSRIVVDHQIQAERLTVRWLLARMYWQGVSRVRSARHMVRTDSLWGEGVRRALILVMFAPVGLIPTSTAWLIGLRWRWWYARGFLYGAFANGYRATSAQTGCAPSIRETGKNVGEVGMSIRTH